MWLLNVVLRLVFFPIALILAIGRYVYRRYTHKPGKASRQRVAVIGGGIAGCGAAWALKQSGHEVVLYEERETLGGNAKTFTWDSPGNPTTGNTESYNHSTSRAQRSCLAKRLLPQL